MTIMPARKRPVFSRPCSSRPLHRIDIGTVAAVAVGAGRAYAGAAALLGAGFVGGLLVPGHWGEVAVGVYAGQALVLLGRVLSDTGSGGLWPLGLMVLALYSLIALLGALLGSALRRRSNHPR